MEDGVVPEPMQASGPDAERDRTVTDGPSRKEVLRALDALNADVLAAHEAESKKRSSLAP